MKFKNLSLNKKMYRRIEIFLFKKKEILIDGKPFFIGEWFATGILSIKDLQQETGQFLT